MLDHANQALGATRRHHAIAPRPRLVRLLLRARGGRALVARVGTQSSVSDLLLFEHEIAPGVPSADVEETSSYLAAINHGLRRMGRRLPAQPAPAPRDPCAALMAGAGGGDKAPGPSPA